jgi:hypothetical protein
MRHRQFKSPSCPSKVQEKKGISGECMEVRKFLKIHTKLLIALYSQGIADWLLFTQKRHGPSLDRGKLRKPWFQEQGVAQKHLKEMTTKDKRECASQQVSIAMDGSEILN